MLRGVGLLFLHVAIGGFTMDERGLAGGGNAHLGPAFGANALFAGQERLDVQLVPVRAIKLDTHRARFSLRTAARGPSSIRNPVPGQDGWTYYTRTSCDCILMP